MAITYIIVLSICWRQAVVASNKRIYQKSQHIQAQQDSIRTLTESLEAVKQQKTITETQLQEKAAQEAALQSKIDQLNKDLQSKREREANERSLAARVINKVTFTKTTYAAENLYAWGNCTYGVASWVSVPNGWGHARSWAASARAAGYLVDSNPTVGSIAQTTAGGLGHVALVIGVGNGQVTIQEMNAQGLGVTSTRVVLPSAFVYIHI